MISIKMSPKSSKLINLNWWTKTKAAWPAMLLLENRKNWTAETDYKGKPWKALSPAYSKWKRRNYGSLPMLRVTGKMLEQATIENKGNRFNVVTSPVGMYHQFGTTKMPARPWMGVSNASLDILSRIAIKHILK